MPRAKHPDQSLLNLPTDDFAIDPRDWHVVKLLADEMELELAERRQHLLVRISNWSASVKIFRKVESKKVYQCPTEPNARDLEYHRVLLTMLMGQGESLQMELREHKEIDPGNIGIRYEDVTAMLKGLRREYFTWHAEMKKERAMEILGNVFETTDTAAQ